MTPLLRLFSSAGMRQYYQYVPMRTGNQEENSNAFQKASLSRERSKGEIRGKGSLRKKTTLGRESSITGQENDPVRKAGFFMKRRTKKACLLTSFWRFPSQIWSCLFRRCQKRQSSPQFPFCSLVFSPVPFPLFFYALKVAVDLHKGEYRQERSTKQYANDSLKQPTQNQKKNLYIYITPPKRKRKK